MRKISTYGRDSNAGFFFGHHALVRNHSTIASVTGGIGRRWRYVTVAVVVGVRGVAVVVRGEGFSGRVGGGWVWVTLFVVGEDERHWRGEAEK